MFESTSKSIGFLKARDELFPMSISELQNGITETKEPKKTFGAFSLTDTVGIITIT